MDASPPPCFQPDCMIDSCHYTAIVDTGSFVMNFGNSGAMFNIEVVSGCRWVLYDTCTKIGSGTPSFEMNYYFTGNEDLMVCGSAGDLLMIFTKHVPEMNYPMFGAPILDLDTICGVLNAVEPSAGGPKAYKDIYTFQIVDKNNLSAGVYIELDAVTFRPSGRKVCIVQ